MAYNTQVLIFLSPTEKKISNKILKFGKPYFPREGGYFPGGGVFTRGYFQRWVVSEGSIFQGALFAGCIFLRGGVFSAGGKEWGYKRQGGKRQPLSRLTRHFTSVHA